MSDTNVPNVAIIMARCCRHRHAYGIRIEEYDRGNWIVDWAFTVSEDVAKRERYDDTVIEGLFFFGDAYPGCPHCGEAGVVLCRCDRISCWDGKTKISTCAWCGSRSLVAGQITRLAMAGDR